MNRILDQRDVTHRLPDFQDYIDKNIDSIEAYTKPYKVEIYLD